MKFYFKLFIPILTFIFEFISIPKSISAFEYNIELRSVRSSYRSNFKNCCASGKQLANSTRSCSDYSSLQDTSSGCRYAFTICCNQNRRTNECDRGKKHAYSGLPCADLKQNNECDTLVVN